jgi:hypothetical protein
MPLYFGGKITAMTEKPVQLNHRGSSGVIWKRAKDGNLVKPSV